MSAIKEKESFLNTEKKLVRKKRRKKALIIALSAVVAVALLTFVLNVISKSTMLKLARSYKAVSYENRLVPEKDENGAWTFTTDEPLRVMQLTDIHLGIGYMSAFGKDRQALNAVAAMITAEKPDLVIVTGDLAYPVPFQSGTFNNKSAAIVFSELMEALGVYWTMTFGNHDIEIYAYYSREDIADFYENSGFKYCIFKAGPDEIDGNCNNVIKVKNTDGIITNALISLDSHSYIDSDIFGAFNKYDNIHENQVQWYKAQINALNNENKNAALNSSVEYDNSKPVQSLLFFHIPLVEYSDAWEAFKENGYKNTGDVEFIEGFKGEEECCGTGSDSLFEAALELGSTKAMFCGHDHINYYSLNYKGIVLSYGYSIDCLAYPGIKNRGSQRGCTVITCNPDSTYEINKYNYYSDRYANIEGFEREETVMQYDGETYEMRE